MKFPELRARLTPLVRNVDFAVNWYVEGEYSEATFSIAARSDGSFALLSGDGRGKMYQLTGPDGQPLVFSTEDAACEYIWQKMTEPQPTASAPEPSAERLVEKRRKLLERLGVTTDPSA